MNTPKYYKHDPKFMYGYAADKMYETKIVWRDSGMLASETYPKPLFIWCCSYCLRERRIKHIPTGHDHTDYSYDICDCEWAKAYGKPWKELL